MVGYDGFNDDHGQTRNINVDWDNKTYTVSDLAIIDRITDMTTSEVGIVGANTDGFLHQRIVNLSNAHNQSNNDLLKWEK